MLPNVAGGEHLARALSPAVPIACRRAAAHLARTHQRATQRHTHSSNPVSRSPPDKLSKLKEDVKTGFVKTIFGDSPERKRADDDTRPSPSENPLANKGAEIEKAAIASNSPLKPTEVSKDKIGNMKRTQGHS